MNDEFKKLIFEYLRDNLEVSIDVGDDGYGYQDGPGYRRFQVSISLNDPETGKPKIISESSHSF